MHTRFKPQVKTMESKNKHLKRELAVGEEVSNKLRVIILGLGVDVCDQVRVTYRQK
jgi:hypothetical protein